MDRPNPYQPPDPTRLGPDSDPPGGYAQMPESMPDPAGEGVAPFAGDVPPMSTPPTVSRFDPWNYRETAEVDTGPWIFGKKVMLPAGTVTRIDALDQKVYVDRAKEQIKNAPEYDPDTFGSPEYRDKIGGYYGTTYDGH